MLISIDSRNGGEFDTTITKTPESLRCMCIASTISLCGVVGFVYQVVHGHKHKVALAWVSD